MIALATIVTTKSSAPSARVTGDARARSALENSTTPVPSLSRLSASTTVERSLGARSRLNRATTATGSVADSIAPRMNASPRSSPVAAETTRATTAAVIRTPGAARIEISPNDRRSSARSSLYAASNTSPGRRTARISSGVIRTSALGTSSVSPRPAMTRATELGTAVRRAMNATPVAIATSRMNSSTGSSPAVSLVGIGPPWGRLVRSRRGDWRRSYRGRHAIEAPSRAAAGLRCSRTNRRMCMDLGLGERRALVGGGASGIGKGIATALAGEGARAALVGRSADRVETEAAKLDGLAVIADLATAEGPLAAVEATVGALGGLDLLVVNSGGPPGGTFDTLGEDEWDQAI